MSQPAMMTHSRETLERQERPDKLTLIAVSSLAYVLAVALHEHVGHALACSLLGGHPKEMGAFYVDCDYGAMRGLSVRLVALAGPLVSLLTGAAGFRLLRSLPLTCGARWYFTWLIGSLGLMSASGYLLFSGVSGVGDVGVTRDGVFYDLAPEWFWRIALTAAGAITYYLVIRTMRQTIDLHVGETNAIKRARRITLISYLTGAIAYAAIGLLNPHGFEIIAMSVLPSSLGGTCGLLVMWSGNRGNPVSAPQIVDQGLDFPRNWIWIGVAVACTVIYAAIFGPTLWL